MTNVHVGQLVKRLIEKKGMKKNEFARLMNYSEGNISSLFAREDWYLSRVLQASAILKENILLQFIDSNNNMVMEESPVYMLHTAQDKLTKCETDLRDSKEMVRVLLDQNKYLKQKVEELERKGPKTK